MSAPPATVGDAAELAADAVAEYDLLANLSAQRNIPNSQQPAHLTDSTVLNGLVIISLL